MIVLDTNVVSEAMKPQPHPAVLAWLDAQVAPTLFIASVTLAELWFGIGALPSGRRKDALTQTLEGLLPLFEGRILAFDTEAARQHAQRALRARAAGHGLPISDGYIAATAAAHGFGVATRDTAPFMAAGVAVINPWMAQP
jgi:toxin FitB